MDIEPIRTDAFSLPEGAIEAVRFLLIGAANSLVDAGLYFALSSGALLLVLPKLTAKAAAYLAGVANSFYWNRRWTFRSERPVSQTLLPFLLVNVVGLGINVGLLHFALGVLRLHEIFAVVIATAGAVGWNFSIAKYLVFKPNAR